MDKIQVIDEFLEEEELKIVINILDDKSFKYYNILYNDNKNETSIWRTDLNNELYISKYITSIIEKYFFKKFQVEKVYCNGQIFGQDGFFHRENQDNSEYIFCLYINCIKKEDITLTGGYIYFQLPNFKYKICYEPIHNRGILFPSNYIFKENAFARFIKDMRRCIVWKLKEII